MSAFSQWSLETWAAVVGIGAGAVAIMGAATSSTRNLVSRLVYRFSKTSSPISKGKVAVQTGQLASIPTFGDPDDLLGSERDWSRQLYLVEHIGARINPEVDFAFAVDPLQAPPLVLLHLADEDSRKHDVGPDPGQRSLHRAILLLRALAEHPAADDRMLQEGGFIAMDSLRDYALAQKLFDRALAENPQNGRHQLNMLLLKAERAALATGASLLLIDSIISIAIANPYDIQLIERALAFIIQQRQGLPLLEVTDALLQSRCPFRGFLWLQRAAAQRLLDEIPGEVTRSYDSAISEFKLERVRTGGDPGDLVAALVAYAKYLMVLVPPTDLTLAEQLLNEAVALDPANPEPYRASAELFRVRGDKSRAEESDRAADRLSNLFDTRSMPPIHPDQ